MTNRYQQYLNALTRPFQKLSKLEFLQPDNSVAFTLDNSYKRGYNRMYDSRAFIQTGSLSVALQNGQRRKASVTLSNADGAFDYSVNKIWHGRKIRLSMGLVLPDGSDFYFPQGVFYIANPNALHSSNQRQITYNLVDKWAYLDGTLFGTLPYSYEVAPGTNVFKAMQGVLQLSVTDLFNPAISPDLMLDNQEPVFTNYYNNLPQLDAEYFAPNGTVVTKKVNATDTAFTTVVEMGGTAADVILDLNRNIVAHVGYDPTGAFRVEPSQDDISDLDKPVMWTFDANNSALVSTGETVRNEDVYNSVLVIGQGLRDEPVYGEAINRNLSSDANVFMLGLRTWKESNSGFWNRKQCNDYAYWLLKRKTVLQKSISVQSSQMFHLLENRLISVQRTDKAGSPFEKHLIQSFTLPIGENGSMSINAASVFDYQNIETDSI